MTMLVNRYGNPFKAALRLIVLVPIVLPLACGSADEDAIAIRNPISDYVCKDNCEVGRFFKPFSRQAVHLEIEPTGEMSQVMYNVDPAHLKTHPLVLKKTIRVTGRAPGAEPYLVEQQSRNGYDKPAAFSDIIAIPLLNQIGFLSPRIPTSKSRLNMDAEFQIDLLSGLSYALILNPAGSRDRAPIHVNVGTLLADGRIDFPADKTSTKITGRVISQDTEIFVNQAMPLMHARVIQGSRLVSSLGMVSGDGKFSLELSSPLFGDPVDQPITLIVEPIDIETALPRIKQKLKPDLLKKDLDVGNINLGKLKKPISVTIEIHGSDDSTIGNAFLYMSAKVGAGESLVKKQVDGSGTTIFPHLYEGTYDIAIVPPFESKFAMRVVKAVEFDSHDNTQISIDLQKREALNATVSAPTGRTISGAQIEFSRIGEIGDFATEDIYDDMLFKLTASTNDEGRICHRKFGFSTSDKNECATLVLDEGRYLAHIIPPAGSQLSHKWVTFDFPEQNMLSITLDQPEMLVGQILAADFETPIKRAFITVYLAENSVPNQPKVIGNAITDDQGFFRAFVSTP